MSKKSRLDLLVRVRYLNPLPPPPFPPKLFNITTDINRLGEPSYLNHLASSTPLPMLVDSDMGMPLDLNAYEGVWDGNDATLNPLPDPNRALHPADVALLGPISRSADAKGHEKPPAASEVSWMRNSNLFMRKTGARRREGVEAVDRADMTVDTSEAEQILAIDKTFLDLSGQNLDDVRHPDTKKRSLRVVESYDILPDDDAWANPYIMIRFPERPSAATAANPSAGASSPRLSRAVLRPIMEDEQQIMEYYLPREDDLDRLDGAFDIPIGPEELQQIRVLGEEDGSSPQIDAIFPSVHYDHIRTYEVVNTQTASNKEILMTFREDQGKEEPDAEEMFEEPAKKKRRGAYFKEINMRTLLRKTRAKRRGEAETRGGLWDKTRIGYRIPDALELTTRQKANELIKNPNWVNEAMPKIHGGENAAEGHGEAIDDEEAVSDDGADRADDDVDEDD